MILCYDKDMTDLDHSEFKEEELGEGKLYGEIKKQKESADLRAGLDRVQSFLSGADFYLTQISRSGSSPDVMLGDYGNTQSFTNDYTLEKIFQALEIKSADNTQLSVQKLRQIAASSSDDQPSLSFEGHNQAEVAISFYAGKDRVNFDCWLKGLSDQDKTAVITSLQQIPPKIWATTQMQQISEQQGQILDQSGLCALATTFSSPNLNSDITYFLNNYNFGPLFGWTNQQVEGFLSGNVPPGLAVDSWIDPQSDERWVLLPNRDLKGIKLALRKQSGSVDARLLLDTAEMRGKNVDNSFLESTTSKELISVFEKIGLKPSDEMLSDLSEGSLGYGHYDGRYGNGYADLSRLVTYLLRRGLSIDRLVGEGSRSFTVEQLQKESVNLPGPAKLIVKMMVGLMTDQKEEGGLRLSHFSGQSLRDGSCKDSEVYFSSALKNGKGFLKDDFVCKSGFGSDTKMNIVPITASGVEFPAGFLFRVSNNGDLEPLRATMYCFNSEEAKDAFGWQYQECLDNDPGLPKAIDTFPEGWILQRRT